MVPPYSTNRLQETVATSVACIDGSLGKGNLGDDALLDSFCSEHASDFINHIVIGSAFGQFLGRDSLPSPFLLSGWRSFRTLLTRRKTLAIWKSKVGAEAVYILLGGLLGHLAHVDVRAQFLTMAKQAGWRRCYYFGDMESFCLKSEATNRVLQLLFGDDAWVSCRSIEAANLLRERGFRGHVHLGIDPVLYRNTKHVSSRFARTDPSEPCVALVPSDSVFRSRDALGWWVGIVRAALEMKLEINWCIYDSSHDIDAAKSIADAAGISIDRFWSQVRLNQDAIQSSQKALICFTDRYHGAIFPMTRGVPTVGRGWNDKIIRLFHLLALDEWCCKIPSTKEGTSPNVRDWIKWAALGRWKPDLEKLKSEISQHDESIASFRSWLSAR